MLDKQTGIARYCNMMIQSKSLDIGNMFESFSKKLS